MIYWIFRIMILMEQSRRTTAIIQRRSITNHKKHLIYTPIRNCLKLKTREEDIEVGIIEECRLIILKNFS